MQVLLAKDITSAELLSSNAPEVVGDEVLWTNQVWPIGSTVYRTETQRIYRAAFEVPVDTGPPEVNIANAQLPYWVDMGPTNRWAMFDGLARTQTIGDPGEMIIELDVPSLTDIWVGNISQATAVEALVRNGVDGDIIFQEEKSLSQPVTNYWDWWFAPFTLAGDVVFSGIPAYRNSVLTLRIISEGTPRVGMVAVGNTEYLGETDWRPSTDFRLSHDNLYRELRATVHIGADEAPRVTRFMNRAMRRPAVWIPEEQPRFEGLRSFGQLVDSRMSYPSYDIVNLDITVREQV